MDKGFTEQSQALLESLFRVSEQGLMDALYRWLIPNKYNNFSVVKTEEFLYVHGDIPIMLVAHLDTVFKRSITKFTYDKVNRIYKGEEGLGADDRAGVFAIIKIIERGYRPCLLFTLGEESGGWGAIRATDLLFNPEVKYMIELDRANEEDCVFYECANPAFTEYVESFGFKKAEGSFTDISILMPDWETAGVNLSVGYHHEHTPNEDLHINVLYNTINKVCNMLDDWKNAEKYKFIPDPTYLQWLKMTNEYRTMGAYDDAKIVHCSLCNNTFYDWEDFPFEIDGVEVYVCPECLAVDPHIRQCEKCYSLFYTNNMKERVCDKCRTNTSTN